MSFCFPQGMNIVLASCLKGTRQVFGMPSGILQGIPKGTCMQSPTEKSTYRTRLAFLDNLDVFLSFTFYVEYIALLLLFHEYKQEEEVGKLRSWFYKYFCMEVVLLNSSFAESEFNFEQTSWLIKLFQNQFFFNTERRGKTSHIGIVLEAPGLP